MDQQTTTTETPEVEAGEAASQDNRRQVRLRVDESKMTRGYANAFRSSVTNQEVVIDLGMNLPQPSPAPHKNEEPQSLHMTFELQHRAVMNYATAKRLALQLSDAVRQYEQQHGEIGVR